ncbi:MAG: 4-hydroxythreonine-4-phosphate dehydrogenase [Hyphomicrobiales bacterium]
MDFIFMLTNKDRTVPNCLEVMAQIADLGLTHVGFKDVGVDLPTLKQLAAAIRKSGATSYVEVVSTTPETIRQSIAAAAELGVDRVLGGQDIAFAQENFGSRSIGYYPFPGRPEGHPTKLGGSQKDIEDDCTRAMEQGCPGVDLLAYRAVEEDPLKLIRAARRGLGPEGYLIVAGSIDSTDRIRAVADAGADAFTIGSAIFEESFAPGVKGVRGQCEAVVKALGH